MRISARLLSLLFATVPFAPSSLPAQEAPSHFEVQVIGGVDGKYVGRATHERAGAKDGYRLLVWLGESRKEAPFRLVLVLPGSAEEGHQMIIGDYVTAETGSMNETEAYAAVMIGDTEPLLSRSGTVQVTRIGKGGLSLRLDIETHPVGGGVPLRVRGYADSRPAR